MQDSLLAQSKKSYAETVFVYSSHDVKLNIDRRSDERRGAVISQINSNSIKLSIAFSPKPLSESKEKWTVMKRVNFTIYGRLKSNSIDMYKSTFTFLTEIDL